MKIRLSDYIMHFLEQKGIEAAFLLSGGGMMHSLDAIGKAEKLNYFCNHHEQASGIAAEAYAKYTGKPGACFVTSGPGGTNTLTAVEGAWLDSTPVMFFSGQSKVSQTIRGQDLIGLRQFGYFEVDIIPMVESCTKYSAFVKDPKTIRYHLEKAHHLATQGRPGPVFLDIPVDVQGAIIETDGLDCFDESELPVKSNPEDHLLINLIAKIKSSKRPVILAGHGVRVANSTESFKELIGLLNIPVTTTSLAIDIMAFDDEHFIGHPGVKGDRAGNLAVQNADLIINIGSSFHVSTTGYEMDSFSPGSYKVMIELDDNVVKKQEIKIDERIDCSIQYFTSKMIELLKENEVTPLIPKNRWHEQCALWKSKLNVMNEPHTREKIGKDGLTINIYDLIDELSLQTTGDETIVTDAGSTFYTVGQSFRVKKTQRVINSGGLGAMGYALPAAIGAAVANPKVNTICVTGDGSLQVNIQELATIKKYQPNVKIFIINNGGYASIRNTQNGYFSGNIVACSEDSGVWLPSLEKIATAYELPYVSADEKKDLGDIVRKVLNSSGPVICEIYTAYGVVIIPTVSSMKLEDGTMISKPIDEMAPFHTPDEIKEYTLKK